MKFPHNGAKTAATLAAIIALIGITGCSTAAEPELTPTPSRLAFETDEEAFAAAETVYREYIRVYNTIDYSDPRSFDALEPYLSGAYRDSMKKSLNAAYADSINVTGNVGIISFIGVEYTPGGTIIAVECSDLSEVDLVDKDGTSLVSADRSETSARKLTFSVEHNRPRISNAELKSDADCSS